MFCDQKFAIGTLLPLDNYQVACGKTGFIICLLLKVSVSKNLSMILNEVNDLPKITQLPKGTNRIQTQVEESRTSNSVH